MLRPFMLTEKIESFSEMPSAPVLDHGRPSPHPSTGRTHRCLTSVSRRNRITTPHAQPVITATLQQWKANDGRILRNGRVWPIGHLAISTNLHHTYYIILCSLLFVYYDDCKIGRAGGANMKLIDRVFVPVCW